MTSRLRSTQIKSKTLYCTKLNKKRGRSVGFKITSCYHLLAFGRKVIPCFGTPIGKLSIECVLSGKLLTSNLSSHCLISLL